MRHHNDAGRQASRPAIDSMLLFVLAPITVVAGIGLYLDARARRIAALRAELSYWKARARHLEELLAKAPRRS